MRPNKGLIVFKKNILFKTDKSEVVKKGLICIHLVLLAPNYKLRLLFIEVLLLALTNICFSLTDAVYFYHFS